jgi:hypothetical protein
MVAKLARLSLPCCQLAAHGPAACSGTKAAHRNSLLGCKFGTTTKASHSCLLKRTPTPPLLGSKEHTVLICFYPCSTSPSFIV